MDPVECLFVSLAAVCIWQVLCYVYVSQVMPVLARAFFALWRRLRNTFATVRLPWRVVVVSPVFPMTEGFFRHRDGDDQDGEVTHYYRFPKGDGGKLMRLVPSGGSGIGDDFRVNWDWLEAVPTTCGESALPGGSIKKCSDQTLWKGTFKVNTCAGVYDSMGLNLAGCALVSGHAVRNRDFVVLAGGNSMTSGVKVATSRFFVPPRYIEGSGTDFAVAQLTGNEWAALGAKSLTAKDFTSVAAGAVDMQFGQGSEGILHGSSGRLPVQVRAAEKAGIVLHKTSTKPGASGGAVRRFVGGVPKYVAFHVARPDGKFSALTGSYNVAIHFDMIFSFMRSIGLYHDSVFDVVMKAAVGESLDYDMDNVKDPLNFDRVVDECYADAEMWERTQEMIDQQIHGDEWSRYDVSRTGRRGRRHADLDAPAGECAGSGSEEAEFFDASEDEDEPSAPADVAPEPCPPVVESAVPPGLSLPPVVKAVVGAAACIPLMSLDFAVVKKQVINGDFSFAPVLKEAVEQIGVDAVHAHVLATDAFALFRDYLETVQPQWFPFGETLPDENGKVFFEKVGEYRVEGSKSPTTPDRKKKPKVLNESSVARADAVRALIKDLGCEDDDWVTPDNSRANIYSSMKAHAALACVDAPPATAEEWSAALAAGCEDFDTSVIASHAQQGFEGWYKLAATLADTSAGVSARFRRQTKKQWATDPELLYAMLNLVQCRLILMLIHESVVEGYTPETVVKKGLKDVLLLSVKQEPHAPRKALAGRFRMIWINSLIDCFVQKLLHKALNARDIEHYQSGKLYHSAAGMGHHDEGVEHLCEAFDSVFGDEEHLLTCDASMWDFTMDKQAHLNHALRRCMSCADPAVAGLIMTLAHLNYKHVCENKGDIWRCNKEGVNTSGQSSTTADNTFSRHSQAKVCGATKFVGNGDDMVADVGFDPEAAAKFGTKSRDVVIQPAGTVPFTSHHFDRASRTASYDRPVKLAFNLLANCTSADFGLRVDAMLSVVRNTPDALLKFKAHLGTFAQGTDTCNKDLLWAI